MDIFADSGSLANSFYLGYALFHIHTQEALNLDCARRTSSTSWFLGKADTPQSKFVGSLHVGPHYNYCVFILSNFEEGAESETLLEYRPTILMRTNYLDYSLLEYIIYHIRAITFDLYTICSSYLLDSRHCLLGTSLNNTTKAERGQWGGAKLSQMHDAVLSYLISFLWPARE